MAESYILINKCMQSLIESIINLGIIKNWKPIKNREDFFLKSANKNKERITGTVKSPCLLFVFNELCQVLQKI